MGNQKNGTSRTAALQKSLLDAKMSSLVYWLPHSAPIMNPKMSNTVKY